jgi:ribonuclease HI
MADKTRTQSGNTAASLPAITIYTDGACSPNPGPGGWGAVLLRHNKKIKELSGSAPQSTNNKMELTAAIKALAYLDQGHAVALYTDSQYLRNGITRWISGWLRNGWRTADRTPVKNAELWQELLIEIERHEIQWHWVRGHGADKWNNRADELAVAARGRVHAPPASGNDSVPTDAIHLYTGVSCRQSAGSGGWASILSWRDHVKLMGEHRDDHTANQLYLCSVIAGLQSLRRRAPVLVHTFSGYLYDGATTWLAGWRERKWRTKEGTPVSNRELWQQIAQFKNEMDIYFVRESRDDPPCLLLEAKELAREYEREQ